MNKKQFNEKQFEDDIKKYEKIIDSARYSASEVINLFMIITFYQIGADISKKGIWKNEYLRRVPGKVTNCRILLSKDNLVSICKFSWLISFEEIASLKLQVLPWQETKRIIDESVNHDDFIQKIREEHEKGEA